MDHEKDQKGLMRNKRTHIYVKDENTRTNLNDHYLVSSTAAVSGAAEVAEMLVGTGTGDTNRKETEKPRHVGRTRKPASSSLLTKKEIKI